MRKEKKKKKSHRSRICPKPKRPKERLPVVANAIANTREMSFVSQNPKSPAAQPTNQPNGPPFVPERVTAHNQNTQPAHRLVGRCKRAHPRPPALFPVQPLSRRVGQGFAIRRF